MFDYFVFFVELYVGLHSVLVEIPDIWQKRSALAPKHGENLYLRRIFASVSDKNYHKYKFL